MLGLLGWGLIVAETVLGVSLLVFYKPKITLSLTIILFVIFQGATIWAWITGATEDCGCFGALLKFSPAAGVAKNTFILGAAVAVWFQTPHILFTQNRGKRWAVVAAGFMGLLLPLTGGFSFSSLSATSSQKPELDFAQLDIQGIQAAALDKGNYVVIVMDTECEHCLEEIYKINELAEDKKLPDLIALVMNMEDQVELFREAFQPLFPVGQIPEKQFWRLLGQGDIPRTLLIKSGRTKKIWDLNVPSAADVKDHM
jgi:hypothetical protein